MNLNECSGMQEAEIRVKCELDESWMRACASKRRAAEMRVGEYLLVGLESISLLANTPLKVEVFLLEGSAWIYTLYNLVGA